VWREKKHQIARTMTTAKTTVSDDSVSEEGELTAIGRDVEDHLKRYAELSLQPHAWFFAFRTSTPGIASGYITRIDRGSYQFFWMGEHEVHGIINKARMEAPMISDTKYMYVLSIRLYW
jgi:hypothetical protein